MGEGEALECCVSIIWEGVERGRKGEGGKGGGGTARARRGLTVNVSREGAHILTRKELDCDSKRLSFGLGHGARGGSEGGGGGVESRSKVKKVRNEL